MTEADDALKTLHARIVDARAGYAEGVDLAEKPDMIALFRELHRLHRDHAATLAAALADRGVPVDDGGSMMAQVNKAVLTVRSALTGLEENVLPVIRDSEKRNLVAYDETIVALPAETAISDLIERQRDRLAAHIAQLDQMRADV